MTPMTKDFNDALDSFCKRLIVVQFAMADQFSKDQAVAAFENAGADHETAKLLAKILAIGFMAVSKHKLEPPE